MEKFIIENLGLLIAVFFLIGLVLIQRWKITSLQKCMANARKQFILKLRASAMLLPVT